MTAALLWTLGALVFAAEIVAIVVLIARDGGAELERDARLAEPLNLPPAREDLAGDVEVIHIGRPPMPVRQTPTDLAAAYEPLMIERFTGSLDSWGRPVNAELAIAAAQRIEAIQTGPGYQPRHARRGPITEQFDVITAQLVDEPTTEIGARAA